MAVTGEPGAGKYRPWPVSPFDKRTALATCTERGPRDMIDTPLNRTQVLSQAESIALV